LIDIFIALHHTTWYTQKATYHGALVQLQTQRSIDILMQISVSAEIKS